MRVGLEDSLWYGKGQLAKSSAEQVGRIRRILEELGLEVATPDEARAILGTKGQGQCEFLRKTAMLNTLHSGENFERAQKVLPSGYTRQMAVADPIRSMSRGGEGAWITDVDGNRFLDWVNNFSAQIHGHAHPRLLEAINRQARQVQSSTMPSEWEIRLAEILVDRLPGVDKVRFMNSGTEANIVAIKAARAYTGKSKVAKMEGGYHGQYDLLEASFQPHRRTGGQLRHLMRSPTRQGRRKACWMRYSFCH